MDRPEIARRMRRFVVTLHEVQELVALRAGVAVTDLDELARITRLEHQVTRQ